MRTLFQAVVIGLLLIASCTVAPAAEARRERLSLDRDWLFHEGDVPFPPVIGHGMSYGNAKSGQAWGAAASDYDDSSWKTVNLPHDWAVAQPFDSKNNVSQGYRARGMGWYRKYFRLDPADRGKHLELQFDGIATHATIWVNGVLAERNWCGYTSAYVDITPFARYGTDTNTVAVQVDAVAQEGWWYEGAGLYRHTWLVKRNAVHIATDGVFANPVRDDRGQWTIPLEVTLDSIEKTPATVDLEATLIDPDGHELLTGKMSGLTVGPLASPVAKMTLVVPSPKLWSVDQPTLYALRTRVLRDGVAADEVATRCGFRHIRFDPDKGFLLNDKPLKLCGTCNHQDMAGVGVAVPDSIWDWRVRRLKEMGSNAYRCAHNAPAAELLEACDRLGMLVMDENRNFGSAPEYLKQLTWMVRRDRNHPSIVLWSVFNEEPSEGSEMGFEMVRRMSAAVKTLDTTRPVTAAQNGQMLNSVNASQAADVTGFNYASWDYDQYHRQNPTQPVFSSEDTSTVMTRGVYATDRKHDLLDAYDTQVLPWGLSHRDAWMRVATRPWVCGQMVWTGFDYRGEPQPLEWPAAGSSFGCMDLCGFPKTAYYIHQAQWITDRPVLALAPHWNWPGKEGQPVKVMVLTNQRKVTLSLNGQSLGEHDVDAYQMLTLDVPYAAGILEAVATSGGRETARCAVETTGVPAALKLVPDRTTLAGDGWDAVPVTVEAVDADGRVVPTANTKVTFELTGPGAIIGLNNGDPTCHEPEKGNLHSLYNGLAQVILQSAYATSGPLTLRATADGLTATELTIDVRPAPARPAVPPVSPTLVVNGWRMSPVTAERPDPNQRIGDTDMNTWTAVRPGRQLQHFSNGQFAVLRAVFHPRTPVIKAGGLMTFRDLTGKAEIYVNETLAAKKDEPAAATIRVPLPAGLSEVIVSVLVEAAGDHAGLGGPVTVDEDLSEKQRRTDD